MLQEPTTKDLLRLRAVADFLFDSGAGAELFPDGVKVTKTMGRIRQVWSGKEILCTIRASDGFIVLNRKGAEILHGALKFPRLRVAMSEVAAPFVAQGKTVFAKHVVDADPEIRPGEEVLIVDGGDRLLGSGKAILNGEEMVAFQFGVAVRIRRGQGEVREE